MADNTLALLKFLSSKESTLPLLHGRIPGQIPSSVYFSIVGKIFFLYSATTAEAMSLILLLMSAVLARITLPLGVGVTDVVFKGFYAIVSAVVGAVVGANLVALCMDQVLHRALSWFSNEAAPLLLFGPPALAGELSHLSGLFKAESLLQTRCSDITIPFAFPKTERNYHANLYAPLTCFLCVGHTICIQCWVLANPLSLWVVAAVWHFIRIHHETRQRFYPVI